MSKQELQQHLKDKCCNLDKVVEVREVLQGMLVKCTNGAEWHVQVTLLKEPK